MSAMLTATNSGRLLRSLLLTRLSVPRSYNNGCNKTNNPGSGVDCKTRFKTDWQDVYKTSYTPAIQHLKW